MSIAFLHRSGKFKMNSAKFSLAEKALYRAFGNTEGKPLVEIFNLLDWPVHINQDTGWIDDIASEGTYLGQTDQLFAILGPFVEPGSYIECSSGDSIWTYYFDGKSCKELENSRAKFEHHLTATLITEVSISMLGPTPPLGDSFKKFYTHLINRKKDEAREEAIQLIAAILKEVEKL